MIMRIMKTLSKMTLDKKCTRKKINEILSAKQPEFSR